MRLPRFARNEIVGVDVGALASPSPTTRITKHAVLFHSKKPRKRSNLKPSPVGEGLVGLFARLIKQKIYNGGNI